MKMQCCLPTLLAIATTVVVVVPVSVVYSGFLPLERAIPLSHRVELESLRARDRACHAQILRGVVSGVIDFSVQGTSDPSSVGYRVGGGEDGGRRGVFEEVFVTISRVRAMETKPKSARTLAASNMASWGRAEEREKRRRRNHEGGNLEGLEMLLRRRWQRRGWPEGGEIRGGGGSHEGLHHGGVVVSPEIQCTEK